MDPIENHRATAHELVAVGRNHGIDLEPLRQDFVFDCDQRYIDFWRKDELPGSGSADEPAGTLHYNMQGAIAILPSKLKGSEGLFQGAWSEAGTFDDIEQAFELLKAWLIDKKEIDDLPNRCVRRYQI